MKISRILAAAMLLAACGVPSGAKRKSKPAQVVQQIGGTRVSVRYNRPSARGRPLFGGIVPWDSVWCPGADEGTRIETSRDLLVSGRALPQGAYTVWMVPRASGPWTLIFSRKARAFHVPYPGAEHDALRIPVTPRAAPYTESLAFDLPVATADSAVLEMRWGTVAVPFSLRPR